MYLQTHLWHKSINWIIVISTLQNTNDNMELLFLKFSSLGHTFSLNKIKSNKHPTWSRSHASSFPYHCGLNSRHYLIWPVSQPSVHPLWGCITLGMFFLHAFGFHWEFHLKAAGFSPVSPKPSAILWMLKLDRHVKGELRWEPAIKIFNWWDPYQCGQMERDTRIQFVDICIARLPGKDLK